MEPATPVECALAVDTLQKLAEENVIVTILRADGHFHVELRRGNLRESLDCDAWSPRFVDAVATSLDQFRRAWSDDPPSSKPGPTMRFVCSGPCWTGDCECRKLDGLLDPRSELRPPVHEDCACVLEPVE